MEDKDKVIRSQPAYGNFEACYSFLFELNRIKSAGKDCKSVIQKYIKEKYKGNKVEINQNDQTIFVHFIDKGGLKNPEKFPREVENYVNKNCS